MSDPFKLHKAWGPRAWEASAAARRAKAKGRTHESPELPEQASDQAKERQQLLEVARSDKFKEYLNRRAALEAGMAAQGAKPRSKTKFPFHKQFSLGMADGMPVGARSKRKKGFLVGKKLPAGASAEDYIEDFVHSSDKRFAGDSKKQRIRRALGAFYGKK